MDHEERIKRLEEDAERTSKRLTAYGDALAVALTDLKRVCDAVTTLGSGYTKLSESVAELDVDQKKMRKTMHKLESSADANGMGIAHLIDINNLQTPMIQRVDRIVMGDGSVTERLKDYGQRFSKWDKIVLAFFIAAATFFGGWVANKLLTVQATQQKIEKVVAPEGTTKP